MKKNILPVLFLISLIIAPIIVMGTTTTRTLPDYTGGDLNVWKLLTNALNWFFNVVLIIASIMIVFVGYSYIVAGGDSGKTKKALDSLIYILIGVGITLLAKVLVYIVDNFLGTEAITSTPTSTLPLLI